MSDIKHNDVPDMGHDADGIRELDNFLPRWWLWLFYITTIFAVIYLLVYHVFNAAPLQEEQWKQEMAAAKKQIEAHVAATGGPKQVAAEASTDPAVLALGKELFTTKSTCWTCHAPDGGGMPALGPNLTDGFKLNGHSFADTVKVIADGSPKNPVMIPWKTMLKPDEIYAVASHVWNLKGTTPATPKPPEGVDAEGKPATGGAAPAAAAPAAPAAALPTEPSADPAVLALGKELFTVKSTCWTCHAPDGGGMPALGPNLTDGFKINGHSFADSLKVITDGSPKNPIMIPWKTMLKPEEIYAVASHIWTLKGTTPANPKPAEGVDAAGTAAPPIPGAPLAPAATAAPAAPATP